MKYYKFIPKWKSNRAEYRTDSDRWFKSMWGGYATFIGDNSICQTKFKSIEDGLEAARIDGTCLREDNWEILECSYFGLVKTKIMLRTLQSLKFLADETSEDCISKIYHLK